MGATHVPGGPPHFCATLIEHGSESRMKASAVGERVTMVFVSSCAGVGLYTVGCCHIPNPVIWVMLWLFGTICQGYELFRLHSGSLLYPASPPGCLGYTRISSYTRVEGLGRCRGMPRIYPARHNRAKNRAISRRSKVDYLIFFRPIACNHNTRVFFGIARNIGGGGGGRLYSRIARRRAPKRENGKIFAGF